MTDRIRRSFLTSIAVAMPALALAPTPARAWTAASTQDVGLVPASGLWAILEHVTDGTDPSTSVIAPPHFSDDIKKVAGTEITLTGYLQPVSTGFGGQKDYLLSRNTFHCPYCYAFGRGSLALASIDGHVPGEMNRKVTVRGTLVLQDRDPSDFYFQLKNARVA
jgi:hypothetical protein